MLMTNVNLTLVSFSHFVAHSFDWRAEYIRG